MERTARRRQHHIPLPPGPACCLTVSVAVPVAGRADMHVCPHSPETAPEQFVRWLRCGFERARAAVAAWRIAFDTGVMHAAAEEQVAERAGILDAEEPGCEHAEWMSEKFYRRMVMLLAESSEEIPQLVTNDNRPAA